MKIVAIVIHPNEIWRILSRIGWSLEVPEFDPPIVFEAWNVSQLISGTIDGFPPVECEEAIRGPDPPTDLNYEDPPHWEDSKYVIYDSLGTRKSLEVSALFPCKTFKKFIYVKEQNSGLILFFQA